jgi:hypothetical protein
MGIAGIIAGAELNGRDIQAPQFFKNFIEGKLRQQRGETADSHMETRIS